MANALKYGTKNPSALKFDVPIVETISVPAALTITSSEYNFLTDWTVNPAQPQDGIEVSEHTVKIYKFKPKLWIIKSNYQDTDSEAGFLNKFYDKHWSLSNFTSHDSYFSSVSDYGSYKPIGLVLSPINSSNTLLTTTGGLDWPINQGCLKGDGVYGWANYGYIHDTISSLYVCSNYYLNNGGTPASLYNSSYPQMAIAVFTAEDTAADGTISIIDSKELVDPTTVEGFTAAVGADTVYTKAKTYANVIQAYDLENEEHNTFVRPVEGKYISILSTWQGVSTAFVVDERAYENLYSHIRLPEITDLTALISSNYPVKFWGNIEQDGVHPTIWTSISNAFADADISDGDFCQCLFANAATNNPVAMTVNIDLVDDDHYINMGDVLAACSAISEMHFNIGHGALKSLHEAFVQTRNLSQVTFNKQVNIADFSGTFEGSTLTAFPTNVAAGADWQTQLSEPTCLINFAADAAKLTTFGIANDNNPFVAVINPYCAGAFARSDIQTIEYVLDMKFVEPIRGAINYDGTIFNSMFGDNSALVSAKIANLNKGDWRLDGTASNGNYAGNLVNLDATSVNYMLNNVFDLRRNSSQASYFENEFNSLNGWAASSGTKRPIVFEGWETCTLTKNLSTSGTMEVILSLVNCSMSLTNGGNTTTIPAGTTQINLASGATTITFTKTNPGENMVAVLQLTSPFKAELTRNLSAANIYLPAGFGSKIDSSALTTANARGWTVYVGGSVYNG